MSLKKTQQSPEALRKAIIRRLPRRTAASGQIRWPAIPALLEHYMQALGQIFAGLGRPFSEEELEALKKILSRKLKEAFTASPFSKVIIDYKTNPPPNISLNYTISYAIVTMDDEYAEWVENRQPPLFGAHPDAKVVSLARALGSPSEVAVLDVGAGTGRNTLPLAKEGFKVDAVELAPALAKVLRKEVKRARVAAKVFEGDALDPALEVPKNHYRLVVLAEVVASHFRDVGQLRRLFERADAWLAPGGLLLFSAFVADSGYQPDTLAREASQVYWCCLFTRSELDTACKGLALTRVSDESTYDFEHEHLPAQAWPPTGWFEEWSRGLDLFDVPAGRAPHELRWLVYRKEGSQLSQMPQETTPAFSDANRQTTQPSATSGQDVKQPVASPSVFQHWMNRMRGRPDK